MSGHDVELVVDVGAELGEGPLWDGRVGRLIWLDVAGHRIHSTDPVTGATSTIIAPTEVGAVVPRADGGFVAALADGFWTLIDGRFAPLAGVAHPADDVRFNDGRCDPAGRFWAGTMANDHRDGGGSLYRLDADGSVTTMLPVVSVSNGIAWSADASTMYYVDSTTRRIDAFTFDVTAGTISDRRTVVEIERDAGYPDGMTIDADDAVWVALWSGGVVRRYVGGRLDDEIELPVRNVTSCAFGGPELTDLYVTTSRQGLSDGQRAEQPHAGGLFRIRGAGRGVLPDVFVGPGSPARD